MSRLEDLPPDLHAVLSLVLRQHRAYADVAGMLGIEERAVHDRAHAALAMLAPRQARELSTEQRERVGEYLLGQDESDARRETRTHLESEGPARAWAQALAAELATLAREPLPEIPAARRETGAHLESQAPAAEALPESPAGSAAAPLATQPELSGTPSTAGPPPVGSGAKRERPAETGAARSSRRGGIVVLGATAVVVLAAVALIVGVGGGSGGSHTSSTTAARNSPPATSSTPTTSSTSTTTGSNTSKTAGGEPHINATLPLTAPNPASKALGIVEVLSRGSVLAFLVVAEHLPPTTGFRYAAWLYNSPTDALLLGSGPKVGSNGILKAAGGLPANASRYHTIILTEERSEKPSQPGSIVLSGTFKVG